MDSLITTTEGGFDSPFSHKTTREILSYTRIISPIALLVIFLVAFVAQSVVAAKKNKHVKNGVKTGPGGRPLPRRTRSTAYVHREPVEFSRNTKLAFKCVSAAVILTFIVDAGVNMAHVIVNRDEHWWCGQAVVVYIIGSFFVFSVLLISLIDTSPAPTFAQLIPWVVAIPLDLIILGGCLSIYTTTHHEPKAGDMTGGRLRKGITSWEAVEAITLIVRILLVLSLVLLYAMSSISLKSRWGSRRESGDASERTGLLSHVNGNGSAVNGDDYGATPQKQGEEPAQAAWVRPNTIPSTSWWEYLSGYSLFFPYLWPSKSRRLQIIVVVCFLLIVLQRVVNVMVPIQVELITNILASDGERFRIPWLQICLYILYRWLQGTQGLVGSLRSYLWIPVGQYSYMELSTAAFEHVHGLSLDFHLGKKTGEVLSALSKGNSINTFLEQITFQVLPMLVDLGVAIGYFMIKFDTYYALVVAVVTFMYLYVTVRMAQWRAEMRRDMVNSSRQEDAVKNDSLVSYESVKYFNAEDYEFGRYRSAVRAFQTAEYHVLFSLTLMNTCQNTVFMLGLLITCFIAAYQVSTGQRRVGQFVSLLTYMAQLQGPLNFFGTFYRSIQSALINSERMLELFRERPTVVDNPTATDLPVSKGDITFKDVRFSYDTRKPALNGLTFHCKPGTTTALVGESGGGKSTVFRLLFRFYNASSGDIRVDGHRVESVTIDSLRRHIGVVPQDTVLFNETLMYNLKYANQNATDEDVYEACRAASIHDKIMSFPDGYETKVGERGLRLSGGEKQRVAIARTILKNPRVILLDEATAALDTETEEHIQEAFSTLSQGRTMLVIAHRLSTITTADQILVLHDGQVAESGSHDELLAMNKRYASMWRKQIRAQNKQALHFEKRAQRLRSASTSGAAGEDSPSQSDEDRQGASTPRAHLSPDSASSSKATGDVDKTHTPDSD
ncbi:hypothetical protein FQN54_005008 [Arachnomyces sp. PD_36]|nr:hypothetical protein FQN54_005008 [Arachnomyces sp. PD_36]